MTQKRLGWNLIHLRCSAFQFIGHEPPFGWQSWWFGLALVLLAFRFVGKTSARFICQDVLNEPGPNILHLQNTHSLRLAFACQQQIQAFDSGALASVQSGGQCKFVVDDNVIGHVTVHNGRQK